MDIKQLFTEEDAVSPVIGVILMVAITVILAAVIGTFVLGLGDQVQDTAPQASFAFDYGTTNVVATHDGGDTIAANDKLELNVDGSVVDSKGSGNTFSAGDSLSGAYSSGNSVRVVWTSANGDSSATLGKSTAP